MAYEPNVFVIRGIGLPFVSCCSYLISASIPSNLRAPSVVVMMSGLGSTLQAVCRLFITISPHYFK